ncbi:MAG: hypothetical protein WC649_00265 [Desulfobacteria bacterium]
MEKEKIFDQDEVSGKSKINELDQDWDDYLEEILYYGIESWRGG